MDWFRNSWKHRPTRLEGDPQESSSLYHTAKSIHQPRWVLRFYRFILQAYFPIHRESHYWVLCKIVLSRLLKAKSVPVKETDRRKKTDLKSTSYAKRGREKKKIMKLASENNLKLASENCENA